MGDLAFQNSNKVYIHSTNAPAGAAVTPWKNPLQTSRVNPLSELSSTALETYQRPILNRLQNIKINGKSIENLDEVEILNSLINGVVEGWNDAVENSAAASEAQTDMSRLMASISGLSKKISSGKLTDRVMDNLLARISRIFQAITNADPDVLMCVLTNATYTPNSQLGKYFNSIKSQYENQTIQVTSDVLAKAEELKNLFVSLSAKETSYGALQGAMRSFFGANIGEPMVQYIFDAASIYAGNQVDKILTGSSYGMKVTKLVNDNYEFAQQSIKFPEVKSDNFFVDANLSSKDGQYVVSGSVGFSDKWSGIGEFYKNKQGITQASTFRVVQRSPVVRYIDEIANSIEDVNNYSNAFFRNEDEEIVYIVEKTAIIAGLGGTGSTIYTKSGNELGIDVTLFFVANGKFYSVYTILANILKSKNWRSSFSISYIGGRPSEKDNVWQEDDSRNLLAAQNRSDMALAALRKAKYDIRMKYASLKSFAK